MSKLWTPYIEPPSLPRAPKAPAIFDNRPHRNAGSPGIANENSTPEWDNKLIATAVQLGMPRVIAEQARNHPPLRFALLTVWCDVQDAAEGDGQAKERVDYYRFCYEQMRKDESISDDLERVTGFIVDR